MAVFVICEYDLIAGLATLQAMESDMSILFCYGSGSKWGGGGEPNLSTS